MKKKEKIEISNRDPLHFVSSKVNVVTTVVSEHTDNCMKMYVEYNCNHRSFVFLFLANIVDK